MIEFTFLSKDGTEKRQRVARRRLAIAGWTGRDSKSVQMHIDELAALGVPPPIRTPLVYKVASSLLTTSGQIEVQGDKTSGEAEFFLFQHEEETWVGIGSDHTCRGLEVVSVPASKQVCAKPIGGNVWKLRDIEKHWDEMELRSYTIHKGVRQLYQQSKLHHILPPDLLTNLCEAEEIDLKEYILFCGTVPLSAPWCTAEEFTCELYDPVLERSIECAYRIHQLS